MLQSILVYSIVILAVIAAIYKMVHVFITEEDKESPCSGCASCPAKKELLRNMQ